MSETFAQRLRILEDTMQRKVGTPLFLLVASMLPYLLPAAAARWALPSRPWAGLAFGLLSIALALAVWWQLRRRVKKKGPGIYVVALLVCALFLGIGAFAAVSATIYTADPSSYRVVAPKLTFNASPATEPIRIVDTFGFFADYYLWNFLDLVPSVQATKTLKLIAPADPMTLLAAFTVFSFRVYVLFALLASFTTWRKNRKAPAPDLPD